MLKSHTLQSPPRKGFGLSVPSSPFPALTNVRAWPRTQRSRSPGPQGSLGRPPPSFWGCAVIKAKGRLMSTEGWTYDWISCTPGRHLTCKTNPTAAAAGSANLRGALREPQGVQNYFPTPPRLCLHLPARDSSPRTVYVEGETLKKPRALCSRSHNPGW